MGMHSILNSAYGALSYHALSTTYYRENPISRQVLSVSVLHYSITFDVVEDVLKCVHLSR